jgi:hypothetical protein
MPGEPDKNSTSTFPLPALELILRFFVPFVSSWWIFGRDLAHAGGAFQLERRAVRPVPAGNRLDLNRRHFFRHRSIPRLHGRCVFLWLRP